MARKISTNWTLENASLNEGDRKTSSANPGLTLAAMSLGFGVVQLDVTIVNTAMPAIGTSLEAKISRTAMDRQRLHHCFRRLHPDREARSATGSARRRVHGRLRNLHGCIRRLRARANGIHPYRHQGHPRASAQPSLCRTRLRSSITRFETRKNAGARSAIRRLAQALRLQQGLLLAARLLRLRGGAAFSSSICRSQRRVLGSPQDTLAKHQPGEAMT